MAKTKMKFYDWIAIVLLIIGGLNWGIFGFAQLTNWSTGDGIPVHLISLIIGNGILTSIIFILVGLASIWSIVSLVKLVLK